MSDENNAEQQEEGVEVPYQQIDPETLQRMIQEFVSRDGADWGDAGCTLAEKVEQVLQQLRHKQAKIVFDLRSQTVNIVAYR
ncbi:YheU family protein [Malonomonas rubra]|uniref:YheU family protein n=1 Tax=Malonomonas rubra TaxID=57040 RepID=UPI0026EF3D9B|nr:YheU family protein [Malonomonas rubra]